MPDELKELLKKPIEAVGTVEIVAAQGVILADYR